MTLTITRRSSNLSSLQHQKNRLRNLVNLGHRFFTYDNDFTYYLIYRDGKYLLENLQSQNTWSGWNEKLLPCFQGIQDENNLLKWEPFEGTIEVTP